MMRSSDGDEITEEEIRIPPSETIGGGGSGTGAGGGGGGGSLTRRPSNRRLLPSCCLVGDAGVRRNVEAPQQHQTLDIPEAASPRSTITRRRRNNGGTTGNLLHGLLTGLQIMRPRRGTVARATNTAAARASSTTTVAARGDNIAGHNGDNTNDDVVGDNDGDNPNVVRDDNDGDNGGDIVEPNGRNNGTGNNNANGVSGIGNNSGTGNNNANGENVVPDQAVVPPRAEPQLDGFYEIASRLCPTDEDIKAMDVIYESKMKLVEKIHKEILDPAQKIIGAEVIAFAAFIGSGHVAGMTIGNRADCLKACHDHFMFNICMTIGKGIIFIVVCWRLFRLGLKLKRLLVIDRQIIRDMNMARRSITNDTGVSGYKKKQKRSSYDAKGKIVATPADSVLEFSLVHAAWIVGMLVLVCGMLYMFFQSGGSPKDCTSMAPSPSPSRLP